MSNQVQVLRRDARVTGLTLDALMVVGGSLFLAAFAQLYLKLPFTPVPVTGQTFAVLVVGGALGAARGGAATLLYLGWIAAGLPFGAEGNGGADLLALSSASAGYLWGFVVAAVLVGWITDRDREVGLAGTVGAMFIGSVVIYLFGIPWLSAALGIPVTAPGAELNDALEFGLYPFVVGDILKLLLAAGVGPAARRLLPRT